MTRPHPDSTARQRFPRCAHCGELIVGEPVSVTAERPDGTLVRHECCRGECALALRCDPVTGRTRSSQRRACGSHEEEGE